MSLWELFSNHNGKVVHKWIHYFPIYEKYFQNWRNKSLLFWEIGVSKGGSLQMWKNYFGSNAIIVGIDIDPNAKSHSDLNVHVEIGDQKDINFLDTILNKYGIPDIVIDDGSHVQQDIITTFQKIYPLMHKNGIYLVEDLHTAYWPKYGGGLKKDGTFMEFTKGCLDKLNAYHSKGAIEPDHITTNTFGIHVYDSVVVFEKGIIPSRISVKKGN